jgi:heavy metal sensor kinase
VRLPIRARLTLVSAGLMAVVLAAAGAFLYVRLRSDLLHAVDAGLRSRAQTLAPSADREGLGGGVLVEPDESFAQILGASGEVLESSPGLRDGPLLPPGDVSSVTQAAFFEAEVQTSEEPVPGRLLAVPLAGHRVLVVGASLEDQQEALSRLVVLLSVGGPVALALAAGVGWVVAGAALRPVERMRAEASAISASEPGRRLPVPDTGDEVARLGETLNELLARLEEALERERRFVDDASHEIRTPLANLKVELELALRRSRSAAELQDAVRGAARETERLARLAEDLLVLARADRGRLPVRRERVEVADVVGAVVAGFGPRVTDAGVTVVAEVPPGLQATLDPLRMGQALGNLLDNALAHTPRGGTVSIAAGSDDGVLTVEVADSGTGFPAGFESVAFEPFARPDPSRARADGGTGLGLAIVQAVAEAHGGAATARNRPEGGASVVLRIPREGDG